MHIFLFIYQFPKSNVLSFEFRMRGPLKESISCFLIRLSPLVLVPNGLFHNTQSILSCRVLMSSAFYISKTTKVFYLSESSISSVFYISKTINVFSLAESSMSSAFYIFQRLFESFVKTITIFFSFQRLSESFVLQRLSMSSTLLFFFKTITVFFSFRRLSESSAETINVT